MENLEVLGIEIKKIIIRPHPSENINKYNWVCEKSLYVEKPSSNKTLLEQIVEAEIVVGCESMAMIVGLLAQKRVISSIPRGGKKCGLPHSEIEHLQDIIFQKK